MAREQVEIFNRSGYDTYFEEARKLIDHEIENLLPELTDLGLRERIEYVLHTKGKRLRPILVMLSTQSVGGNIKAVKKLALAIELMHAATLIHDDILDQDVFRRNLPTVNAKWGVRDAVLAGDALASLSINLTADYGSDITKIMSRTCLLLSDGEYMDVENAHRETRENDYMETIRRKSASLFEAATKCGAIAVNAREDEIEALAKFGENFGLAYQIKDDLSDVTSFENAVPQDINKLRATLPIIHFCQSAKPNVREAFFATVGAIKSKDPSEMATLLDSLYRDLENAGSLRHCENRINQHVDNAVASLKAVKASVYKTHLIQMADWLRLGYSA